MNVFHTSFNNKTKRNKSKIEKNRTHRKMDQNGETVSRETSSMWIFLSKCASERTSERVNEWTKEMIEREKIIPKDLLPIPYFHLINTTIQIQQTYTIYHAYRRGKGKLHIYHIGILQAMTLRNEMENLRNVHTKRETLILWIRILIFDLTLFLCLAIYQWYFQRSWIGCWF